MVSERIKFPIVLLCVEFIIVILFDVFVRYGDEAEGSHRSRNFEESAGLTWKDLNEGNNTTTNTIKQYDPMFQDVHVMIFIGFGFLMTFLRKYGYSAVGYTLMISALAIQWSVLCRGLFHREGNIIPIDITSLINGDFAAASVLISFGAILGISSPLQLLVMALVEVFLYAVNEFIGVEILKAVDIGGSMFIHTFGAYFGLAVSLVMRKQSDSDCHSDKEEATVTSDLFAMIGTIFLWMFWPSFNGVMATTADDQHRAVLNTVLSLTGSCLFSFAMSALLSPNKKFNMVHIQNATLAGGVAVGATANLLIQPFGALIIGGGAGILSTVGYVFITPFLQNSIGLHDTCGVHNLHGMPGVLAGLIGAIVAFTATAATADDKSDYGKMGQGRTRAEQASYQLAALGVTLLISIVGGVITGSILRIPALSKVETDALYDDSRFWSVPLEDDADEDQESTEQGGVSQQPLI